MSIHTFFGSLRAKGTLNSEPRFSPPARCDFSHARKLKRPFQRKTLDKGHFPFLAWEKSHLAGGMALRVVLSTYEFVHLKAHERGI